MGFLISRITGPWLLPALVACIIGGAFFGIRLYGNGRYEVGRQEVQAEMINARLIAEQEARNAERAHQEKMDVLAKTDQQRIARLGGDLRRVASDGDRLREHIRAAAAGSACGPAQAAGQPDGAAATIAGLLESCSVMAEQLGGEAERLADAVRGLQAYAAEVTAQPIPASQPTHDTHQ